MKVLAKSRLFWFLKEGTELDLNNQAYLDMYVQQILTRGKAQDIKELLGMVDLKTFKESFERIKNFLPAEVKKFWENGLGGTDRSSEKNNSPL
jgi:hypothetical protein